MQTPQATLAAPTLVLPEQDPAELLAHAEKADWALLCMVSCVAVLTLGLAAASALIA